MANAATIAEAASFSYANVEYIARQVVLADNLRLHAITFLDAFANFNDDLVPNHPVRDWKAPMAEIAYRLPTALNTAYPEHTAEVARIVFASCIACIEGLAAGRVTAGQVAGFLVDWNTAWGF